MKKVLTLVLALVFVLALAAPAMAFTGDTTPEAVTPYKLNLYLVEYNDIGFFGGVSLPPADRGYAKFEVVAAVAELMIPKGKDPGAGTPVAYPSLDFTGKNVTFYLTDNVPDNAITTKYTLKHIGLAGTVITDDVEVTNATKDTKFIRKLTTPGFANTTANGYGIADKTVKWLFFAKVTGDDASLTVKAVDDSGPVVVTAAFVATTAVSPAIPTFPTGAFSYNGKYYHVQWDAADKKYVLTRVVYTEGANNEFKANGVVEFFVDGDNKTNGMAINGFNLGVHPVSGALGIYLVPANPSSFVTSGTEYDAAMKIYNDTVVGVFKMDFKLMGNFLRHKFFEDLVSGKTLAVTVNIKPWTAYVKVPDNVVVNPPKTGAAASILGFVMVALAGASAVALKKR